MPNESTESENSLFMDTINSTDRSENEIGEEMPEFEVTIWSIF